MGLLNQNKKGDKKSNNKQKNAGQQSKFISKGGSKPAGGSKKGMMTGGANRGS